ncbi:cytochrome P450 [Paenibacillus algorifonticola]|uniref:cytochrome P450 family protein n=1 Tax=Paenibacillus algorifonticola TaxID=684063 RepID=UPI003D2E6C0F
MMNHQEKSGPKSKIDFFDQAFTRNPFPVYSEIRREDPVYRFMMPSGEYAWIVTRYEDALAILKDPRFVTNPPWMQQEGPTDHHNILSKNLLSVGPADHRRLRNLVQKAFTPRMIEGLRGRIEEISNDLLDKVQNKGEMNLIEDFAFPLPIIVICEMLGVPIQDQDKFRDWSNTIMEGAYNPSYTEKGSKAVEAFISYLHGLITERRENPQNDLISDLIKTEEQGDKLSEQEMYALIFVLIIAGHETTVNLIGNGVLALLEFPEQKEKLLKQPELIHSAIEEILRYNGPAEASNIRWVTEAVEFQGKSILEGEMVLISFASANRDIEQFSDPDTLDITRQANQHLAFGKGIHYCLGAPLARLEGEIAISTLLRRMPGLRLKTDLAQLEWRPGIIIRGATEIPVVF